MRKSLLSNARLMETADVSKSAILFEIFLCAHVKILNTCGKNMYLNTAILILIVFLKRRR